MGDLGALVQAVLSGLAAGAVVGLVAVGFTLVWGLTRVLALAHGDVVVAAVLVAVLAVLGSTPVVTLLAAGPALTFVAVAVLTGAVLGAAGYAATVRPFLPRPGGGPAREDVVGWVAAAVAAGLLVRAALGLALPQEAYAVPDPLRLDRLLPAGGLALPGGGVLPPRAPGVLVVGVLVALAGAAALRRGRAGRALRAVAEDPEAAALMGVPTGRLVLAAFAVAGALAGLAGVLVAPGRPLGVDDGVVLGLTAATAALLGRLGSLPGALVAGLGLGVLQALVVVVLGAPYGELAPLVVLVVVLALRPEGLRAPARLPVD